MKIGIDVSMIDLNRAGIGYYALSILKSFSKLDLKNQYFLFTHNKSLIDNLNLPYNFKIIEIKGNGGFFWMCKCIPKIISLKIDAFISPSNLFFGCILKRTVTVIHDIAQVLYPQFFKKKGNIIYRIQLNILLRFSKKIIVPSESVKLDIQSKFKLINCKIFVIKEGLHQWVNPNLNKNESLKIVKHYNLPLNYILFVGTLEPRKNLENLIRGFAIFNKNNPNISLVIVGKKGWFYNNIFKEVNRLDLTNNVQFLGYVPESDLSGIYLNAMFCANLSYYEGFGLPLIESNAFKKIVVYSNIKVFNELNICGIKVEDYKSNIEISKGLEKGIAYQFKEDPDFFDKYSWDLVVKEILKILI